MISNISIVLVEPQSPGNVGMVCRAMKNMGLSSLRLVNPCPLDHPEALMFAVSAKDLLEKAEIYPDLESALADSPLSIATTRRHGKYRQEIFNPEEIAMKITADGGLNRSCIVFGREDSGLTTHEVSLCRWLATIDTSSEYGSMNLAQSVLVFCYELMKSRGGAVDRTVRELAPGESLEAMYGQMESVLLKIGFLNPENPAHLMMSLRRILSRAELDSREISIFRGMMSQVDWACGEFKGKKGGA
ncbi:MAG: RNA methyltransferase [Geobacteraceae bacterium]|nr:RNA methyltransferase [Geobacteraceae bacterium]